MAAPYRLRAGDTGPLQRTSRTCGAACLTVARMLVDPPFASWITSGSPVLPGVPRGETAEARFAAYEAIVHQRTNGVLGAGNRLNAPWPKALGTPPWGARHELENGASRVGTRYAVDVLRPLDRQALRAAYDTLVDVVADGEPGLLYVGNDTLPRHVVLILPGDGDRTLDVYDPHDGRVGHLRRDEVVECRAGLAGWNRAWFAVRPTGARRVMAGDPATVTAQQEPPVAGWARTGDAGEAGGLVGQGAR